jgi:hypothetical protein
LVALLDFLSLVVKLLGEHDSLPYDKGTDRYKGYY